MKGRLVRAFKAIGLLASFFFVLGLLTDYLVAAGMCRWSQRTTAPSPPLSILDSNGVVIGSTWFNDRDSECPLLSERIEPAGPHDDPFVRRGALHDWWRDWLLWLDHAVTGEPLRGGVLYIRFGWPLRSWEAWWVDALPPTPMPAYPQYLKYRPVPGLESGPTIITSMGRIPRGFPVAMRPGPAALNAAFYGGLLAVVVYSVGGWRHARALRRQGRCSSCGYSLVGLRPGVPCPECGATPADRKHTPDRP